MNNQDNQEKKQSEQNAPDYHGDVKISGNAAMPSGSGQPNSKRDQEFTSSQQSGDTGDVNIKPSESDESESSNAGNKTGDPGRTPGKAEGGEDSNESNEAGEDAANYEQTKEKKIAESVSRSN